MSDHELPENERPDQDLPDPELTELESDRLTSLLQQASRRVVVPASPELPVPAQVAPTRLEPTRRSRHASRWLAAAVVMLIAALGATWVITNDDEDRIDTGPADPPVTVAPTVLEESGIWRLPEGLTDCRVVGADLSTSFSMARLAVDDPDDPQRWISIADGQLVTIGPAETLPVTDGVTLEVGPTGFDDSQWYSLRTAEDAAPVSGRFRGVEAAAVAQMFATSSLDAANLASGASISEAIDDLTLPDGLVATWNTGGGSNDRLLQLTLMGDNDDEIVVGLTPGGRAPEVVALGTRLEAEEIRLMALDGTGETGVSVVQEFGRRSDLGRSVWQMTYEVSGESMSPMLFAITDDGVTISASRAALVDDRGVATGEPLSEADQVRIINSLRATTEQDFLEQLDRLGAEVIDADGWASGEGQVTTTEGP